jgi:hypothetical protein
MNIQIFANNKDEAIDAVISLIKNDSTYDMAISIMRQCDISPDEVFTKYGNVTTWWNTQRQK